MIQPDLFEKAQFFAARAHKGQVYAGKDVPYLAHLNAVCLEVMAAYAEEYGFDINLAILCALLHDTLEDTDTTYEQLAETFGLKVADGVRALSKNEALPKNEQMEDSIERIVVQPTEVATVKLADRCSNMQEPPAHWDTAKRKAYQSEAKKILAELGFANAYLARRLEKRIADYAKFIAE